MNTIRTETIWIHLFWGRAQDVWLQSRCGRCRNKGKEKHVMLNWTFEIIQSELLQHHRQKDCIKVQLGNIQLGFQFALLKTSTVLLLHLLWKEKKNYLCSKEVAVSWRAMKTGLIGCRAGGLSSPRLGSRFSREHSRCEVEAIILWALTVEFGGTGAAQRCFELDNQYPEKIQRGTQQSCQEKTKKKHKKKHREFQEGAERNHHSDCILINREDVYTHRNRKRECDRHVKWNNSDDGLRGTSLF